MRKIIKVFRFIIYSPILFLSVLFFSFSKNKLIIESDINRYNYKKKHLYVLIRLLLEQSEFRNLFYFRMGSLGDFLNIFLRKKSSLYIFDREIKEGLIIVHGDSTFINPERLGKNCYINQNVTIGEVNGKRPIIGDNVRIATGAIVIGDIVIGNNTTIAAGAVVVKDVPNDAVVVGNPAKIVRLNGQKVNVNL